MGDVVEVLPILKSDLKAALEAVKRDKDATLEYIAVIAEFRYTSYKAHIDQGFTPEEALELCKNVLGI